MTIPDFHPRAIDDARSARRWYRRRSEAVSLRFVHEPDRAIAEIAAQPNSGAAYLHGTRFVRLRRFPLMVVYLIDGSLLLILAVAHFRRRPGYWKRRLN